MESSQPSRYTLQNTHQTLTTLSPHPRHRTLSTHTLKMTGGKGLTPAHPSAESKDGPRTQLSLLEKAELTPRAKLLLGV